MAYKLAIGAFLTTTNKMLCFEKGVNNTVLLEQCESFRQQKRIEMKTEECERSQIQSVLQPVIWKILPQPTLLRFI